MLELIVACGKNGAIGLNGAIPWHIAEDFKHFKEVTMGSAVLMGRKTFESIGRPLPGRVNVVLTRNASYQKDGIKVVGTLQEALTFLKNHRVFIIGGAQLYKEALPLVDVAWVTEVDASPEADAFFPLEELRNWSREVLKKVPATNEHPEAVFCKYTKKAVL